MLEERSETKRFDGVLMFEGWRLEGKQNKPFARNICRKVREGTYYNVTNDCMNRVGKKEIQENLPFT